MVDSMFTSAYQQVVAAVIAMRKSAGLTQRQLAAALGREHSFVGRVETGQRRIDFVEFIWLCRACGADPRAKVDELMDAMVSLVPTRTRRRR